MASALLVLVPLRLEQAALGRRREWKVLHTGMGPERARIAAARGLAVAGCSRDDLRAIVGSLEAI